MRRAFLVATLALFLAGCAAPAVSGLKDAGEPTVFATVLKKPDPLLMGCYMRSRPSEYKRPNSYQYCLVEKDGRYAVYYDWRDGKTMQEYKGWMPFTIDGDRLISGTEPSTYLVKDGRVWHNYGGRHKLHLMLRQ